MKGDLFDISGKVAIITGGAGVLGGAMAERLAGSGARVGILSRTAASVERKAANIRGAGGEAMPLVADVLDQSQLRLARDKILQRWGQIDILINAAGGNLSGATIMPGQNIFDLNLDAFEQVVDLNLKGTLLPTLVFGQGMAMKGKGSIINISSMAAQRPLTRVVGYGAAKSAVDNLTRWLAVEMAQKFGDGIRVNAIAPGFFLAEQNRDLLLTKDGSYTERGKTIISNTPMKRFGRPEELQGAVHWLCSEAASFVTGTVIPVDGGFDAFSGV